MPRVLRFLRTGLREKPRVALAVALAVFAATALYTFTRPKIYEATAIYVADTKAVIRLQDNSPSSGISCGPGINTDAQVIESTLIAKRVAAQLSISEKTTLLPAAEISAEIDYEDTLIAALKSSRRVHLTQPGAQIEITVRNPKPADAARIATLYASEMRTFKRTVEEEEILRPLNDLQNRIVQVRDILTKQHEALIHYRSSPESGSMFDSANDPIVAAKMREIEPQQELLQQLTQRYRDLSMARPNATTLPAITPATAADSPVSPHIPLNLGAGLLASLTLGTLASAIAARRQSTTPRPAPSPGPSPGQ